MEQGNQIVLRKKDHHEASYIFGVLLAKTPKHTILEYDGIEHVISNSKWEKLDDDIGELALSLSLHSSRNIGKHHISIAQAILKGEVKGISYERVR